MPVEEVLESLAELNVVPVDEVGWILSYAYEMGRDYLVIKLKAWMVARGYRLPNPESPPIPTENCVSGSDKDSS